MKVLAHIHTFNDEGVIELSLEALRQQSRPVDKIIIVDNGSTDGTLDRSFPEAVTIIRHGENLGTNGAIRTGFQYALDHGYDWTWVLDADSAPERPALERLLRFYDGLSAEARERVCFLACRISTGQGDTPHKPLVFTPYGGRLAEAEVGQTYIRCDAALWTCSLYRMKAVQIIGLPSEHYVLDWGELEYGYRARQHELESYVLADSLAQHDIGGAPSVVKRLYRLGFFKVPVYEVAPIRCYYRTRNMIYFWLYESKHRGLKKILGVFYRSFTFTGNFLMRPRNHRGQIVACLRGFWDGLSGRIERRY